MAGKYPKDWKEIADRIKKKHNYCCERCGHPDEFKSGHVLTVHHLIDRNKSNCEDYNLAALCQKCHLKLQNRLQVTQNVFGFFKASKWFRLHLRGYMKARKQ